MENTHRRYSRRSLLANKEQWNYLWKQFQMTGLPMYLIMDKQGNIVKRFTHITAKELKNLLEQEINKI